jgi:hypothetical protein
LALLRWKRHWNCRHLCRYLRVGQWRCRSIPRFRGWSPPGKPVAWREPRRQQGGLICRSLAYLIAANGEDLPLIRTGGWTLGAVVSDRTPWAVQGVGPSGFEPRRFAAPTALRPHLRERCFYDAAMLGRRLLPAPLGPALSQIIWEPWPAGSQRAGFQRAQLR